MVPALEVMLNEGLIRDLIHKGEYDKITEVMEQNTSLGMCTFDQSLLKLFSEGLITEDTTISQSDKSADMKVKIQQMRLGQGGSDAFENMDTSVLRVSD